VTAALRHAGRLGPFFEVELDATGDGWSPLRRLLDDPTTVAGRLAAVRGVLARRAGVAPEAIDARAAASVHFLGFVARLVAPSLAAVALDGALPSFGPDDVHWRPVDRGPIPIAVRSLGEERVADARAGGAGLVDGVVRRIVAPAVDAFAVGAHLSRIVLWGNVASALAGAASVLAQSTEPMTLDPGAIVDSMLTSPGPLTGTGSFGSAGRYFVRASCCLLYRLPGGGKCGDCVLR
jgi:ferric iron reductase protein FhuF